MIYKHRSSIPGHVCIIFELPASVWADRIYLTGDFNDWCENDLPLRQGRDGAWRMALDLPASQRFQFRYLVDGEWQTDWCTDGAEENKFGSQNSVVVTDFPEPKPEAGIEIPRAETDSHAQAARVKSMPAVNAAKKRLRYPPPFGPTVEHREQAQSRPAA